MPQTSTFSELFQQPLIRHRFSRLKKSTSILGQPDIIIVSKIKSSSSFFHKQKKSEQNTQYFINGVLFPTTAHFSTYVSSRYQIGDLRNVIIRAKLLMFDAFQSKDIHVEINIPGSLQVKCYNLQGQAFQSKSQDYTRAYYSSFLRCLVPFNYPKMNMYPFVFRLQNYRQILKNFVGFSFKNSLLFSKKYQNIKFIYFSQQQSCNFQGGPNYALQIVVNFCLKHKFWEILNIIVCQTEKLQSISCEILKYYIKIQERRQKQILSELAQKLLHNQNQSKLVQLQIIGLFKAKKYKQAKYLGQHLLHKGGTHYKISTLICQCAIQLKEYISFLKILNTILTLSDQDVTYIEQATSNHISLQDFMIQLTFNKGQSISHYSELCFPFDNTFINRQKKFKLFKNALKQQQGQKQSLILNLIQRLDRSLKISYNPKYYDLLINLQKNNGWPQLVKIRNQCFWLQSDFIQQEKSLYSDSKYKNSQYRQQGFNSNNSLSAQINKDKQRSHNYERSYTSIDLNHLENDKIESGRMDLQQSFDGELSQVGDDQNLQNMPPCSKRVTHNSNTTRKKTIQFKRLQVKVLCSPILQNLFVMLYEELKLQIDMQKWAIKLDLQKILQFSPQKRELFAILFLKKGLLHKKLCRLRKCEQSLKLARKISQSILILLVSSYQLIHLYIQAKNLKGVQFYIIDLIKIFNICQIQKFDIIPDWMKPMITFVLNLEGIDIIRKISGPFKQLVLKWLRNNYSEQQLFKKQINSAHIAFNNLKQ